MSDPNSEEWNYKEDRDHEAEYYKYKTKKDKFSNDYRTNPNFWGKKKETFKENNFDDSDNIFNSDLVP